MRRPLLLLVALLTGLLVLIVALRRPAPQSAVVQSPSAVTFSAPQSIENRSEPIGRQSAKSEIGNHPSRLADDFNAPGGDIRRDLQILHEILDAWQTNFPRDGNPVGDNAEITAALTGRNRLQLALIPPGHPAINARGELCDRWGTPFFFHQLSGTQMEIRSAGPDRTLHTPDDLVRTPY
jgi:hypothetical protein